MPRKPGAAMTKLELDAEGNGRITSLVIYDKSGNITGIQFSDIREDIGLDDKAFVFKIPKGTEVIEQ
jgi:outer membrane lipoprotein-sorting protein